MSDKVKAGKYVLTAARWKQQVLDDNGKPVSFILHRQGAELDLTQADAERLVKAGAVEPAGKKDKAAKSDDDNGDNPPPPADEKPEYGDGINKITAYVGTDKERAQEYLAAEQAKGDDARSSLVEKLQKVLDAEPAAS